MSQRLCHHCGSDLHIENQGALVYCWNCGAPQVTLSEELREQAEALRRNDSGTQQDAANTAEMQARNIVWRKAIVLAAIVAGALAVLTIVLPPVAFLVWLWAPIAPGIVLSLYAARNRDTIFNRRIGMRVGMICGLLISGALTLINAIELTTLRFGMHRMTDFDANVNSLLAQIKAQLVVQSGQQAAEEAFRLFDIPEFRAGYFVAGFAFLTIFIIVLTTAGGAFAGFMRSRKQTA